METRWIIVGALLVCVLVLMAFLIWKNQKDKKKFTDFLNNDFPKVAEEDVDSEDATY